MRAALGGVRGTAGVVPRWIRGVRGTAGVVPRWIREVRLSDRAVFAAAAAAGTLAGRLARP